MDEMARRPEARTEREDGGSHHPETSEAAEWKGNMLVYMKEEGGVILRRRLTASVQDILVDILRCPPPSNRYLTLHTSFPLCNQSCVPVALGLISNLVLRNE